MAVFKIDNVSYNSYVSATGLKWKRTDLESDNAGRSMDGIMHRSRIAQKRTLTVRCRRLTPVQMQQLCAALAPETITVTFSDPASGTTSAVFYGTEVESTVAITVGGALMWDDAAFTLVER